jgi:hypothetical protein
MNRDEFKDRIEGFADLEDDWDSYRGRAISPVAIEIALALLDGMSDELLAVSWVCPTSEGGVYFESNINSMDNSIEVEADGQLYCHNWNVPTDEDEDLEGSSLTEAVAFFRRGLDV